MNNYDWKDIAPKMVGNWQNAILALTGVDLRNANPKKHSPCPMCGGVDRFRFDDRKPGSRRADGSGGYFCNGCGGGDGMKLYQGIARLSFSQAVNELGKFVGGQPVEQRRAAVKAIDSAPMVDYGKEVSEEIAAAKLAEAKSYPLCPITRVEGIGPPNVLVLWRKDADRVSEHEKYVWANPIHHLNKDGGRGRLCNVSMTKFDESIRFLAGGISYNAATVIDGNHRFVICERLVDGWHIHHQTGATVFVCYSAQNIDHVAYLLGDRVTAIAARGSDIDTIIYAEERNATVWALVGKVVVSQCSAKAILDKKMPAVNRAEVQ